MGWPSAGKSGIPTSVKGKVNRGVGGNSRGQILKDGLGGGFHDRAGRCKRILERDENRRDIWSRLGEKKGDLQRAGNLTTVEIPRMGR